MKNREKSYSLRLSKIQPLSKEREFPEIQQSLWKLLSKVSFKNNHHQCKGFTLAIKVITAAMIGKACVGYFFIFDEKRIFIFSILRSGTLSTFKMEL
jgi:hypothetical protein